VSVYVGVNANRAHTKHARKVSTYLFGRLAAGLYLVEQNVSRLLWIKAWHGRSNCCIKREATHSQSGIRRFW